MPVHNAERQDGDDARSLLCASVAVGGRYLDKKSARAAQDRERIRARHMW